ncbi:MAG: hypothetical protein Q7R92_05070 [bacterium]|nr:hypothetical protein [bacterium]
MEKEVKDRIAKNPYQELISLSGIMFTSDSNMPPLEQYLKNISIDNLEKLTFLAYQIMEFDRLIFQGERSRPAIYLHLSKKVNRQEYIFFYGPTNGGRGKEFYHVKIQEFIELSAHDAPYDLAVYAAHLVRLRVLANFPTTNLLSVKKLEKIRADKGWKGNKNTEKLFRRITPAIRNEAGNCVDLSGQDCVLISHLAASFCTSSTQDAFNKTDRELWLKQILTLDASNYL